MTQVWNHDWTLALIKSDELNEYIVNGSGRYCHAGVWNSGEDEGGAG